MRNRDLSGGAQRARGAAWTGKKLAANPIGGRFALAHDAKDSQGVAVRLWAGSIAFAGLVGCAPGSMVPEVDPLVGYYVARCELNLRCACEASGDETCEDFAHRRAAEARRQAAEHGAAVNEVCLEHRLADLEPRCRDDYGLPSTEAHFEIDASARRCELFHGERALGEPCEHPRGELQFPWHGDDDCDEGLMCQEVDGEPRCTLNIFKRPTVGEVCFNVDVLYGCEPGLVCVPTSATQSVCAPPMRQGDPCGGWQADHCDGPPGLYCDPDAGRCRALPRAGEACRDGESPQPRCHPDYVCDEGTCRLRPGIGEPCDFLTDCRHGLECDQGRCVGGEVCI